MLRLNSSDIWILESVLRAGSCIFESLDFLTVRSSSRFHRPSLSFPQVSLTFSRCLARVHPYSLATRPFRFLSLSAGPPLFYLPHVSPSLLVLLTLPLPLSSSPSYSVFVVFMSASRIQVSLGIFKVRIFYMFFHHTYSAILFLIFHVLSICTVVYLLPLLYLLPSSLSPLFLFLHHSFVFRPSYIFYLVIYIYRKCVRTKNRKSKKDIRKFATTFALHNIVRLRT